MSKNLKAVSNGFTESQLVSDVKESAQQIYLAGLGAVVLSQEEGSKAFNALVKEGEARQAEALKLADEKMALIAGQVGATWRQIARLVESGVERTLDSFSVPTRRDIRKLSKEVLELGLAVQSLAEKSAGKEHLV